MSKAYDVNLRSPKFYSTVNVGKEGYNPQTIIYYNSDDDLIRVEEIWREETWVQTVSGTKSGGVDINQTVSYAIYYDAWTKS